MKWLLIAGAYMLVLYVWRRIEDFVDETKRDLKHANHRMDALRQFICESKVLRSEVDKFEEQRYGNHFPLRDKCKCDFLDERRGVLENENDFYSIYNEKYLDVEPDYTAELDNEKRADATYRKYFPFLEKLHKVEPKVVTDL